MYTISAYLHILAACAWLGAMLFFALVIVPWLRDSRSAQHVPLFLQIAGTRYRYFGWISLGLLCLTGFSSLLLRGISPEILISPAFWSAGFGKILFYKLIFVVFVIIFTIIHDLLSGKSRKQASWIGRCTLLLTLAVLYCAVSLTR